MTIISGTSIKIASSTPRYHQAQLKSGCKSNAGFEDWLLNNEALKLGLLNYLQWAQLNPETTFSRRREFLVIVHPSRPRYCPDYHLIVTTAVLLCTSKAYRLEHCVRKLSVEFLVESDFNIWNKYKSCQFIAKISSGPIKEWIQIKMLDSMIGF